MEAIFYQKQLLESKIEIRGDQREELTSEYNRLQMKLNLINGKIKLIACENLKDEVELEKINNELNKNK